jgi:nucleotide-binding universal stress UspA family protein
MIRTILVAATGDATDSATLAAALAVARPFGAHLDVLHVRVDPINTAVAMAADAGSGALTQGLLDELEQDVRRREAAANDAFTRLCAGAGLAVPGTPSAGPRDTPSAEWHVETGDEPRWMAAYGRTADLIVAARAPNRDAVGRSTLEAVLFETGRPLLIAPAATMPASLDRVAIAWKPSPQAARAVALAMPLLRRAKEVVVATVEEQPEEPSDADRLVRNLAWHGLAARAEQLKPGPEGAAATLLSGIAGRADLLVMGGYGHSRLREWVFGGFTERVLSSDALLPVLIAH